jgi:hypothetical protein
MMTYRFQAFCGLFLLTLLLPLAAHAGEPRLMSTYGNWNTYMFNEDDHKVCYMASKAEIPADAPYKKRGVPYAIITHRPADGTKNVFSYLGGYTYKPGSEVTVQVDGQKFVLFTQEDTAWAPDSETDNRLAKAISTGTEMTVTGTSARGTKTVDKLSLKGSTSAHDEIDRECY